MIDPFSLVLGAGLGATLALLIEVAIERLQKRREFLTLDEVRRQIDADSVQRISRWRERKAETERLSGRGAA